METWWNGFLVGLIVAGILIDLACSIRDSRRRIAAMRERAAPYLHGAPWPDNAARYRRDPRYIVWDI
jgi:hypothetical protein